MYRNGNKPRNLGWSTTWYTYLRGSSLLLEVGSGCGCGHDERGAQEAPSPTWGICRPVPSRLYTQHDTTQGSCVLAWLGSKPRNLSWSTCGTRNPAGWSYSSGRATAVAMDMTGWEGSGGCPISSSIVIMMVLHAHTAPMGPHRPALATVF
jgi:hypothetical protein